MTDEIEPHACMVKSDALFLDNKQSCKEEVILQEF